MTRAQFLKVLSQFGATLDTECESFDLNVDAPAGKVFRENGCHCISESFSNNCNQSWKAEAYQTAADRVLMGLDDCEDPECDICHPELESAS